jgi:Rieske Fe-S protein
VKPGDARSVGEIAPGTGAVVGWGPRKVAAYRDENGALTVCSATCTHLGCVVHFNRAEKSWDCPCHGSRFSTSGEVLNGPARTPLEVLSVDEPGAEPPQQR